MKTKVMGENIRKNPWRGLESYKEGEIIYGRDNDIRALSQCILNNTETLLYGRSGIGKSSILNAGILPAARRAGFMPVVIRLAHKDSEPYICQIKEAIAEGLGVVNVKEVLESRQPENETLYEYFHRHTFHDNEGNRTKLLLIFDQFEEIFTLQDDAKMRQAIFAQLADLLNDIMPTELQSHISSVVVDEDKASQTDESENLFAGLNIDECVLPEYVTDNEAHFVFTIREDYLSEFEFYSANIPSLKHNRFGLRPINEEQASQIILRPIQGLIDEDVAKLIIEKVTGRVGFKLDGVPEIEVDSAVLSLYLNRLYDANSGQHITKELVEQKAGEIIYNFYHEAISALSTSTVEYLEDMLLTGQGRRDNITVDDALSSGNVTKEELDYLCDDKKILRRFNHTGILRLEFVHDSLCPVVVRNRDERLEKIKLADQARRLKALRKQRVGFVSSIIILLLSAFAIYAAYYMPVTERYASTTKRWGRFVGVERLSRKEAMFRTYHYVFKKRGLRTKAYTSIECVNRYGKLHPSTLGSYLTPGSHEGAKSVFSNACKLQFAKNPEVDSLILQERAYDENDNLLYAVNYTNCPQTNGEKQYGTYVDALGLPLAILSDDKYKFVKITRDSRGYDQRIEYFDLEGNPSTNADGAYQVYYEYDNLGQMISISSLNIYGKRMIDIAGNCGMIMKYNGFRLMEAISVDQYGREKAVSGGYSRITYEYDHYGREIKLTLWDNGKPAERPFYIRITTYDDNENSILWQYYNGEKQLIKEEKVIFDDRGNQLYYYENEDGRIKDYRMLFGNEDNRIKEVYIDIENGDTIGVYQFSKVDRVETTRFEGRFYDYEYVQNTVYDDQGRTVETAFYELDGITPYEDDRNWHKVVHCYSDNGSEKSSEYYEESDSVVYYGRDGISLFSTTRYLPARWKKEIRTYNANKVLIAIRSETLDQYGNTIAEYDVGEGLRAVYFKNARTNERNRDGVYGLSRFNFPISGATQFFKQEENGYSKHPCDVDGNKISKMCLYPEMYSGPRDKEAVFIEYVENDNVCYGVLLRSSKGIAFGEEDYSCKNFAYGGDVLCLNLTSMRVIEFNLADVNWSTIFQEPITTKQYELFEEHYHKYYNKIYATNIIVIASTDGYDGDDGYMTKQGYKGDFVVLKWCDWECTQSLDDFVKALEESRDKPKDVILLPFETEGGKTIYKDIIHLKGVEGILGIRLFDKVIARTLFEEQIIERYLKYQK